MNGNYDRKMKLRPPMTPATILWAIRCAFNILINCKKDESSSENCKYKSLPTLSLSSDILGRAARAQSASTMNIDSHYISYLTNLWFAILQLLQNRYLMSPVVAGTDNLIPSACLPFIPSMLSQFVPLTANLKGCCISMELNRREPFYSLHQMIHECLQRDVVGENGLRVCCANPAI